MNLSASTDDLISDGRWGDALFELIKRTASELPADVEAALTQARLAEELGSPAELIFGIFLENIKAARSAQAPLCQDTGLPIFFVLHPRQVSTTTLARIIRDTVRRATQEQLLRHNAVDPLTGVNSGNNLGDGFPSLYFTETEDQVLEASLLLKGGGSENVSTQYSLPYAALKAGRDLKGVRLVVLEAVAKAAGMGCPPGVLGICIGGDRGGGYGEAKRQLLRPLDDINCDPALAEMEGSLLQEANLLGIGPLGLGGKTTLMGVKIGKLHRLPASFFVTISYMCWELRRR
ncbi:MAG: fumarate hydratase, partial [Pseudomonadota bacterium]